jgi:hypothetical protein
MFTHYQDALDVIERCNTIICSCADCQTMCNNPCLPTPQEVYGLLEEGYGGRLMIKPSYYFGEDVYVICPAYNKYEGQTLRYHRAPRIELEWNHCTFLTSDHLCEIHHIKPCEGRITCGCYSYAWGQNEIILSNITYEVAIMDVNHLFEYLWACPEGQRIVEHYKTQQGVIV